MGYHKTQWVHNLQKGRGCEDIRRFVFHFPNGPLGKVLRIQPPQLNNLGMGVRNFSLLGSLWAVFYSAGVWPLGYQTGISNCWEWMNQLTSWASARSIIPAVILNIECFWSHSVHGGLITTFQDVHKQPGSTFGYALTSQNPSSN